MGAHGLKITGVHQACLSVPLLAMWDPSHIERCTNPAERRKLSAVEADAMPGTARSLSVRSRAKRYCDSAVGYCFPNWTCATSNLSARKPRSAPRVHQEAPHKQACAAQQEQRQSDFEHHQRVPQFPATKAAVAAPARFQRLRQIACERFQRRDQPENQRSQYRDGFVAPSTGRFSRISASSGKVNFGSTTVRAFSPAAANTHPSPAPHQAAMNSQSKLPHHAPPSRAERASIANSFSRAVARASSRLATFAHTQLAAAAPPHPAYI